MISDINKNKTLEKPKDLLGLNVALLQISGLLPINGKIHTKHTILLYLTAFFVITQYIEIYITRTDVLKLLRNIKYSMLSSVIVVKATSFLFWQRKWISIIDFVNEVNLERYKSEDSISIKINENLVKHCKFVTKFYCYLTACTVVMVIIHPAAEYYLTYAEDESVHREDSFVDTQKYIVIAPSWVPFDRNNLIVYLGQLSYQAYTTVHAGIVMATFDTCAVCIMVFFRGELELLRIDCQNLFGTAGAPATKENARFRMTKCHKRCNDLMK